MADRKLKTAALSAGLLLVTAAAILLINNFGRIGFSDTWPALVVAGGICLCLMGYLELGLAMAGSFLIWLLANLQVIAAMGKTWPVVLIWLAVVVAIGVIRARSSAKPTS